MEFIHAMPPSKLFRPWDYTSIHLYFSELVSDSFVLLRFIFNPDLLFLWLLISYHIWESRLILIHKSFLRTVMSFEWKNECAYVFGGPYLSFLVSFGVNRYLSGGLYLSFLVSSRANHYPSGGLYLPFWLLRLCNRFCFSFVSLLLFCNLIISDKNMFVNKKIDKI